MGTRGRAKFNKGKVAKIIRTRKIKERKEGGLVKAVLRKGGWTREEDRRRRVKYLSAK